MKAEEFVKLVNEKKVNEECLFLATYSALGFADEANINVIDTINSYNNDEYRYKINRIMGYYNELHKIVGGQNRQHYYDYLCGRCSKPISDKNGNFKIIRLKSINISIDGRPYSFNQEGILPVEGLISWDDIEVIYRLKDNLNSIVTRIV